MIEVKARNKKNEPKDHSIFTYMRLMEKWGLEAHINDGISRLRRKDAE